MTDARLAATDASAFTSRRARREAERAAELAALAANPVGPSPLSAPVPVQPAAPIGLAAPAPEAAQPSLDLGELVAELVAAPEGAPQAEPRHRPAARRHRAAPDTARSVVRGGRGIAPAGTRHPVLRRAFAGFAFLVVGGLVVAVSLPAALFGGAGAATAAPGAATTEAAVAAPGGQAVAVDAEALGAATSASDHGDFSGQSFADSQRAYYQAAGRALNPTFIPTSGAVRWPFSTAVGISAPYGYSSGYAFGWHDGTDFIPGYGAPAAAIAAGVVTWVGPEGELGYSVHIMSKIGGHTVESIYGHMQTDSSKLYPGETVAVGTVVGLTGQTGMATGPHLHLGIKVDGQFTDPYVWLSMNATNRK